MDIITLLSTWRAAPWVPLTVADVAIGDTVYGWVEEDSPGSDDGKVRNVVMFGQPLTVTGVDDEFWKGHNDRRVIRHVGGTGQVHLSRASRVIVWRVTDNPPTVGE